MSYGDAFVLPHFTYRDIRQSAYNAVSILASLCLLLSSACGMPTLLFHLFFK